MIRELIFLAGTAFGLFALSSYVEKRIQRQEYEATKLGFEATLRMIDVDLQHMNRELADLL